MLLSSCAGSRPVTSVRRTHELLQSVLWMQRAAEFDAACKSVYLGALVSLNTAIADKSWSAATEQTGDFSAKPPAIIVDVDETVLDNSPYEARLIESNRAFPDGWDSWCCEEQARAVPGALDYLREADKLGVAVFYVTNRDKALDECTWRNLRTVGFPQTTSAEQVLSKDERDDWGSDKGSRRAYVCRTHRVVQIAGDNLDDFFGYKLTEAQRDSITHSRSAWWGTRWFMLPNPAYGSWERAMLNYDSSLPDSVVLRRKYEELESLR